MDFFLEVIFIGFLGIFLLSFLIVYLFYLFFVILNKKKSRNVFFTNQASIFLNLNKINKEDLNEKVFIQVLSVCNSFILSLTFTFALSSVFDSFILNMFLSFLILIVLILVIYKVVGLFFRKKV